MFFLAQKNGGELSPPMGDSDRSLCQNCSVYALQMCKYIGNEGGV